jgi:hypothetical protein
LDEPAAKLQKEKEKTPQHSLWTMTSGGNLFTHISQTE